MVLRILKKQTKLKIKKSLQFSKQLNIPSQSIFKDVPYYSQWESPQLAESIINIKIKASDDPKWQQSGANSKEEYALWSNNGCGIACLRMMLGYKKTDVPPTVKLGKRSLAYGVYTQPLEKSSGLLYKPFIRFIADSFDMHAKVISPMTLKDILVELSKSNFIMASVDPQIRFAKTKSVKAGGHLVLIVGYDIEKEVLYINNPSGFEDRTQHYAEIAFSDFERFFANQGMVIKP